MPDIAATERDGAPAGSAAAKSARPPFSCAPRPAVLFYLSIYLSLYISLSLYIYIYIHIYLSLSLYISLSVIYIYIYIYILERILLSCWGSPKWGSPLRRSVERILLSCLGRFNLLSQTSPAGRPAGGGDEQTPEARPQTPDPRGQTPEAPEIPKQNNITGFQTGSRQTVSHILSQQIVTEISRFRPRPLKSGAGLICVYICTHIHCYIA